MKRLMTALAFSLAVFATGSQAASPAAAASAASAPAMSKQNTKMADCNKDAAGMKGDERKAFMKTCLTDKKKAQNEKMKTCNADARDMKGDARKAFIKECLSK
ncbi:Phosphate starvation-inducible protein PsiF [Burkholderiaceae bacterium]|nr:Phosphate starvation-inducible protein PsiF [Burkholderiaceae bacterium]